MRANNNYVKIPEDISLIKQKKLFGLTTRQIVYFGIGLAVGAAAFFAIKAVVKNLTVSMVGLGVFAAPFILAALWYKPGTNLHFEDYIKMMFGFLKKKKTLVYKSEGGLMNIERQIEYNRLRKILKDAGYESFIPKEQATIKKVKIFGKIKQAS